MVGTTINSLVRQAEEIHPARLAGPALGGERAFVHDPLRDRGAHDGVPPGVKEVAPFRNREP